ncbi:MAG: hypothetical protein NVS3B20_24100 [Polyangiales bacterium]
MSDFTPRPVAELANAMGIAAEHVELYGRDKAKIRLEANRGPRSGKGRLILVTAINPTPAGEGKTPPSIALAMGMRRIGKNAVLALREPSLGPVFGVKGGGTGGGKASLVPTDDINMHFTGDIHAITSAHNLLSALIDNAIHFDTHLLPRDARNGTAVRNEHASEAPEAADTLDPRMVTWGRALDMNDRALRKCIVGLGGKANGVPREEHFDITAASEIMAILALSSDVRDLTARLGRIVVGTSHQGHAVTARQLSAASAMTAVLRDALKPNLVQTSEGGPAFVHCGPFGNIAHGCNSVLATDLAMRFGDYAITEAGFGFDLGGEKFLDIKCRQQGIWPRMLVIVATLRALKMHGGAKVLSAAEPSEERLRKGLEHLEQHLENARTYGLDALVAINVFPQDTAAELSLVEALAARHRHAIFGSVSFEQ